jgi:hypothetical protein
MDLIEHKEKGNFNITYNKYTANLIELYQKYDDGNLLTDLKSFLLGKISDQDGTKALSLKQAVYATNIKIIAGESPRILEKNPDALYALLKIGALPRLLKQAIEKSITNYNNLLKNPLDTDSKDILEILQENAISQDESETIDLTGEENANESFLD